MKIVLLGFMCSGKTKVGKVLSQTLKWPHYDTDALIEKKANAKIADIIRNQGEDAFRAMEAQAVQKVSQKDKCVISTGGGVPLNTKNMDQLKKDSATFWLRVTPEVVLKRAGDVSSRPMIDPDRPLESIRDLMTQRQPFYEKADHAIETDHLSPRKIVDEIVRHIPQRRQ